MSNQFRCVDAENRFKATAWTVEHLGLPKGFNGLVSYSLHVDEVMDAQDNNEEYVVDSFGNKVAFFSWCVSFDIHRKGDILDVTALVIDPNSDSKSLHRFLAKRFRTLALLNDCKWLSRCKHEGETVRVFFKEV